VVLVAVQRELLAGNEVDGAFGKLPHAQLGTLQVDQDAQGMIKALLDIADALDSLAQHVVAGMAHIDAEHVRTGLGQFLDHLFLVACGPEGGDDLRASHASHCVSVSCVVMSSCASSMVTSSGSTRNAGSSRSSLPSGPTIAGPAAFSVSCKVQSVRFCVSISKNPVRS